MPNPITLLALDNSQAQFARNASQRQRISLTKEGSSAPQHIVELDSNPIPIETGRWSVLHETLFQGNWVKGRGRRDSDYRAVFDDNPNGGDSDFNDAIVEFATRP